MTDYTTAEIDDAIASSEDGIYNEETDTYDGSVPCWEELSWSDKGGKKFEITLRGEKVEGEVAAAQGGCEGGGESIWCVVKVGDQFFKKTGYYASHYGTEWDGDVKIVTPVIRAITFYE